MIGEIKMTKTLQKIKALYNIGGMRLVVYKIIDKVFHSHLGADWKYECFREMPVSKYEAALQNLYFFATGEHLNLHNPCNFNQKIQWLKLYDTIPLKTLLTDKYEVRQWVEEKLGADYLIPLCGVWSDVDDINLERLPEQFVLKATHGSGWNIIVKDKTELQWEKVKVILNKWMKLNWAYMGGLELQYKTIPPRIIAEQYISNLGGVNLFDYKVFCFNGEPEYIQVIGDRVAAAHDAREAFFNTQWEIQPFTYTYPRYEIAPPKPGNLNKMLEVAKILSEGFVFVRVDLYNLDNGDIKFGEMTFTPAAGFDRWSSEQGNIELGEKLRLPVKK